LMLAQRFDARLDLLHVLWTPPPFIGFEVMMVQVSDSSTFGQLVRKQAEEEMQKLADSLPPEMRERVQRRFVVGEASEAIIETAKGEGADLIVMGTHGRSGLSHMVLGSVTEKVVRRAPCPVLTIRAAEEKRGT
ncbi:MAG: universal stress protein, partial [Deltaproteobacteria bacterium]|nr:universal stress protein [Deltaproteobacteria bacterium]